MPKQLSQKSWKEVQQEMSIAGNPEKITALGSEIMEMVAMRVDETNPAELTNILFALDRVKAEIKLTLKRYENRTGQKVL